MITRVLIVDDHEVTREGIKRILEPGCVTVGSVANAVDAITFLKLGDEAVDLVVLDYSLPDMNGVEATHKLCKDFPKVPVLVLSGYDEEYVVGGVVRGGAWGFISKRESVQFIREAAHIIVNRRKPYFSPIAQERLKHCLEKPEEVRTIGDLTERESQVLHLSVLGKSIKEIAVALHIQATTVKTTRKRIRRKTNTHNIAEMSQYVQALKANVAKIDAIRNGD